VTADEFDLPTRTIEGVGQKANEGFVRGGIDRRRGDANAQFIAERAADFVARRARLQLDREEQAVGLESQKGGQ